MQNVRIVGSTHTSASRDGRGLQRTVLPREVPVP